MTEATQRLWLRRGRRPVRLRLLTALTAVAALRGVLSTTFPASEDAPTSLFLGIAAVATVLGVVVWFLTWAWSEVATLTTGLVCVALVVATAATGTGAAGASIGYVWLNLYVAFFCTERVTRAYAAVSVASLGVALAVNPFPGAVAIGVPLALTIILVSEATNRLVAALRRAATTDPLTGMLNRNGLLAIAPQLLAQAQRTARPLTVALIDLDGFKRVNDERGHAAGDEILRSLAEAWRPLLRKSDVTARYGGDEFALVLPDTTVEHAKELLHRLHRVSPIAWSHGLAAAASTGELADLLDTADADLYRAKNARDGQPEPRRSTAPAAR